MIGSNAIALDAAAKMATDAGLLPLVLSTKISDEAREVGRMFADIALFLCQQLSSNRENLNSDVPAVREEYLSDLRRLAGQARETGKPVCVLAGGETVVTVQGDGVGGRNQEMVLSAAKHLDGRLHRNACFNNFEVCFLSAGTDGIDGPTPAAGAIATPETAAEAHLQQLDMIQFLNSNDSYNFFRKLNDGHNHVITGHTGTNVMDMQILLVRPVEPHS